MLKLPAAARFLGCFVFEAILTEDVEPRVLAGPLARLTIELAEPISNVTVLQVLEACVDNVVFTEIVSVQVGLSTGLAVI